MNLLRITHRFFYNLIFDRYCVIPAFLHVPIKFDFHRKQRYFIYENEAREYNTIVEAARLAKEAAQHASTSYHYDYYPDQRW